MDKPMKALIAHILANPHRFTRAQLPCSVWAFWEIACEETPHVIVVPEAHRLELREALTA